MTTAEKTPNKKRWERAYASSLTLIPGPVDYWQLPKVEEEALALFKMVEAGMSVDEVFDLIAVEATDRQGLDEMAAEFPTVADKILEMVKFREQVRERFEKIVAAKQAIGGRE